MAGAGPALIVGENCHRFLQISCPLQRDGFLLGEIICFDGALGKCRDTRALQRLTVCRMVKLLKNMILVGGESRFGVGACMTPFFDYCFWKSARHRPDDFVVGFEQRADADRFLSELQERMAKFGLELHPEKTRLIEFGRFGPAPAGRRGTGAVHVSGIYASLRKEQSWELHRLEADGTETPGSETAANQADASEADARAGAEGRGVARACAARVLSVSRSAGKLAEPEAVSPTDRPLLVARVITAQPARSSGRGAHCSTSESLAAEAPIGAPLSRGPVCRQISKVGAVCGNAARTDLCGGGQR